MKTLGVAVRRPTVRDVVTTCMSFAIVAAIIFGAATGAHVPISDPVTLSAVLLYALLASVFGVDLRKGWRHWALYLSGFAAVTLVFTLAHAALTAWQ